MVTDKVEAKKKPAGWYSKEQRAARAAARQTRQAERSADRAAKGAAAERAGRSLAPLKAYARARLAQLPPREPTKRGPDYFRKLARHEAERVRGILEDDKQSAEQRVAGPGRRKHRVIVPTKERLAKGDMVEWVNPAEIDSSEQPIGYTRRFKASHLDRLFQRGRLSWCQWYAGDWYRNKHSECSFALSVVGGYGVRTSAGEPSYGLPRTEAQLRARMLFMEARIAFGLDMVGFMDRLLLHDDMPRYAGRAAMRNVDQIRLALDRLGRWLALPVELPNAPEIKREARPEPVPARRADKASSAPAIESAFLDENGNMLPLADVAEIIKSRLATPIDEAENSCDKNVSV